MINYIFPKRIVKEINTDNAKSLLNKKTLQIGLNDKEIFTVSSGSSVILDFGIEINGGIRILTQSSDKSKIRVRFGESITECFSDVGDKNNATNDHSMRDFEFAVPDFSDQSYGNTGFRFVRLDFNGVLKIKCIVAKNTILSKKLIWSYSGNDEELKSIFKVAKRTIDLCASSNYVVDGVKRDRLVWYGDLHPEMLALTTLYGRTKQIENSINLAREEYPLPSWLNNFPSYSMWWIINVFDYHRLTNCETFTKKQMPYLAKSIEQMDKCVDEDGEMHYPYYFVDWPSFETNGAIEGQRAINIIAVKKAIVLFREFNMQTKVAENLLTNLLKKEIQVTDQKSIIALKVLANEKITKQEYDKLTDGGAQGFSTFMSYYILEAIAMYNKEKAIELMKEYFSKMIEFGATTFWEDFDLSWTKNSFGIDKLPIEGKSDIHGDFGGYCYKGFRHSLCHGWSTGILAFIKQYCK